MSTCKPLKLALSSEEFTFEGTGYQALGNRIQPGPVQKPHPPLLVGGNSRRAIRRAVELADGWYPFFTGPQLSTTARTAAMTGEEDLAGGLAYLREHCEKVGRQEPPQIVLGSIISPGEKPSPAELIDKVGALAELGVSGAAMSVSGRTRAEWCDNAARLASDVLDKLPR